MRTMRFHVLNETETQKYGKVRPQWKSSPVLFCFADAVVATANVVYGCWPNMFGVRLSNGCLVGCSLLSLWVSLLLVLLNLQMNELLSSSLVVADDAVVSTITAGAPRFGQCCLWLLAKWLSSLFLLLLFVCLPVRVPHFVYKNRKNCLRVVWETSTMNSLENVNVSLVWWFRTFKERGIMKYTHNTDHKKADWLQAQCIEPALSIIKILWILWLGWINFCNIYRKIRNQSYFSNFRRI